VAKKTKPDDPVTALRRRRLREVANSFDSVADFCRRYGLDEGYIGQLINGFSSFGEKSARNLQAKIDGLPPGYFETPDNFASPAVTDVSDPAERYLFATRVYGAVLSAGNGSTHWEHEEIEGSHAFTRTWLQRKRLNIEMCRVLTIDGDSMLPELRHGFVVLIDLSDCSPIKSGKVYALSVDGEQRIKRLWKQIDGSLLIQSDNPDKTRFRDEIVQPEHLDRVRIIGRKRWHAGDDD